MKSVAAAVALMVAGLLTVACGRSGSDRQPVMPRPEAYPRIEMPDSSYRMVQTNGAEMKVNSGTTYIYTDRKGENQWITIKYPGGVDAKVYLTLKTTTTPDAADTVVANRRERMALNLSGADGVMTTLRSEGGWACEMVTSREALSTPIQLIARKDNMVLSGVLYMQLPAGTEADSVAPVINAIDRDMLTLLKSLR